MNECISNKYYNIINRAYHSILDAKNDYNEINVMSSKELRLTNVTEDLLLMLMKIINENSSSKIELLINRATRVS